MDKSLKISIVVDKKTGDINVVRNEFKALDSQLNNSTKKIDSYATKLKKITAGIVGITTATATLKAGFDNFRELDFLIGNISKTTGLDRTSKELSSLVDELDRLATTKNGYIVKDLYAIAEGAGQLGIAKKDITTFTDTVQKIALTTELTASEASKDFARISNVLKEPIKDIERLGSVYNELSNNTTATVRDLLYFSQRIGSTAKQFGMSTAEILGLSAAMKDMSINFEVGGTAVNKTIAQMQAKSKDFAREMRVPFDDFSKMIKEKPMAALDLFLQKLNNLEGGEKFDFLKKLGLGGTETATVLLNISSNLDKVHNNIKIANDEYNRGTSLEREYQQASISINTQLGRLSSSFEVLGKNIYTGYKEPISSAIGITSDFISSLAQNKEEIRAVSSQVIIAGEAFATWKVYSAILPTLQRGMLQFKLATMEASTAMRTGATVSTLFATGIRGVGVALKGLVVANAPLLAITAAFEVWNYLTNQEAQAQQKLQESLSLTNEEILKMSEATKNVTLDRLKEDLQVARELESNLHTQVREVNEERLTKQQMINEGIWEEYNAAQSAYDKQHEIVGKIREKIATIEEAANGTLRAADAADSERVAQDGVTASATNTAIAVSGITNETINATNQAYALSSAFAQASAQLSAAKANLALAKGEMTKLQALTQKTTANSKAIMQEQENLSNLYSKAVAENDLKKQTELKTKMVQLGAKELNLQASYITGVKQIEQDKKRAAEAEARRIKLEGERATRVGHRYSSSNLNSKKTSLASDREVQRLQKQSIRDSKKLQEEKERWDRRFLDEYKKTTESKYTYDLQKLQHERDDYLKNGQDKLKVDEWYAKKKLKLDNEAAQKQYNTQAQAYNDMIRAIGGNTINRWYSEISQVGDNFMAVAAAVAQMIGTSDVMGTVGKLFSDPFGSLGSIFTSGAGAIDGYIEKIGLGSINNYLSSAGLSSAGSIGLAGGLGYLGGKGLDQLFGADTKAGSYGGIGASLGMAVGGPVGGLVGGLGGALIGGLFGKKKTTETGIFVQNAIYQLSDIDNGLKTYADWKKKSWFHTSRGTKFGEVDESVNEYVKSLFSSVDAILEGFGKNKNLYLASGKHEDIAKDFANNLLLNISGKNDYEDLTKIWEDYAKESKKEVSEVIFEAYNTALSLKDDFEVFKLDNAGKSKESLAFQLDIINRQIKALGMESITAADYTQKLNEAVSRGLQPGEIKKWESLEELLKNQTNLEKSLNELRLEASQEAYESIMKEYNAKLDLINAQKRLADIEKDAAKELDDAMRTTAKDLRELSKSSDSVIDSLMTTDMTDEQTINYYLQSLNEKEALFATYFDENGALLSDKYDEMKSTYSDINNLVGTIANSLDDYDPAQKDPLKANLLELIDRNKYIVDSNAKTMEVFVKGGTLDEIAKELNINQFATLLNLSTEQKEQLVNVVAQTVGLSKEETQALLMKDNTFVQPYATVGVSNMISDVETGLMKDNTFIPAPTNVSVGNITQAKTDVSSLAKESTLSTRYAGEAISVDQSNFVAPENGLLKDTFRTSTYKTPYATVGVSNMIPAVETGLAKNTTVGTLYKGSAIDISNIIQARTDVSSLSKEATQVVSKENLYSIVGLTDTQKQRIEQLNEKTISQDEVKSYYQAATSYFNRMIDLQNTRVEADKVALSATSFEVGHTFGATEEAQFQSALVSAGLSLDATQRAQLVADIQTATDKSKLSTIFGYDATNYTFSHPEKIAQFKALYDVLPDADKSAYDSIKADIDVLKAQTQTNLPNEQESYKWLQDIAKYNGTTDNGEASALSYSISQYNKYHTIGPALSFVGGATDSDPVFADGFDTSMISASANKIVEYESILSNLPQFKSGGWTGDGDINDIAGITHKREWVIPQKGSPVVIRNNKDEHKELVEVKKALEESNRLNKKLLRIIQEWDEHGLKTISESAA